jgi:hypothetical protein
MTPETTPSSSGSDTSKRQTKSAERLMVAVRIRPLRNDEPQRALYAVNKKVPNPLLPTVVCYQR